MSAHPVGARVHLLGALLAAAYVAVLLYTAPAIGLSRDEGMYVAAAQSYARWFELLAESPSEAFDRARIDGFWRANNEHPALVKTLFALSYLADQRFGIFTRESLAFRFPGMVSAGLLLWLILVFGTRLHSMRVGMFAACAYALLPRPFYHAHLDCFDIPITLAVAAVSYAYFRSLRSFRWAIWTGVLYGLALATKHNSWILPGIYGLHFIIVIVLDRRSGLRALSPIPYWLIAMALIGPPIFVGSWPWLWHDVIDRFGRYAAFHLHHDYYNMEYFGVNYFWPPFPTSYAWVMTLYTVPTATLLLCLTGIATEARPALARIRASFERRADAIDDPTHASVLLIGCLLAPLVLISMPGTPIFGGTKHWFTAYPFLALFAGLGFDRLFTELSARWPTRLAHLQRYALAPLGAWLLLPALVETVHSHPFALSHYGFAAGFVPGAADRGMNRQFWGFTTGSLVDFFDEKLPNGGRVYACDTLDLSFRMLSRDGLLSERIVPTPHIADADYAIVHHEKHFAEVDQQIWTTYGTTQPVHVLSYDGVPIISVYENPRRKSK